MEIKEHCEKYRVWFADGEVADDEELDGLDGFEEVDGFDGDAAGLDEHPLNVAIIPTNNNPIPTIAPNRLPIGSALFTGLLPQYWNKF